MRSVCPGPLLTFSWLRCALADREEMFTVTRDMEVEVGSQAVISWVDMPGSVTEEEETEFGCEAAGGYPAPVIEITGPASLRLGREERVQGTESRS